MSGNSFGAPSTPLAEAVKPTEPEQFTTEVIDLAELTGINPKYIKGWLVKNDKATTSKGDLRMDFFRYVLECSFLTELQDIVKAVITNAQETLLDEAIESGGIEPLTGTPTMELLDYNAELIKKNKHLEGLLKDTINDKGTKTLKAIQTTNTILQEDNDKLYKEKAELQKERDKAINDLKITMKEGFNEERDQAIKDMLDLLKHIVDIFVEQGIKAKLTDSEIELVEMLYKK